MTTQPERTRPNALREQGLPAAIALLVVLLGGANWMASPERAPRWLLGMLVLPLLWLGAMLWYVWLRRSRPASSPDDERATRRYFVSALTLAAVTIGIWQVAFFGLGIWVRFGDHGADLTFERRILGLASSAVFVVWGNALPKILTPLSILPLHLAERVTSARRFVGTTFVVLGLAMAMAFLMLPVAIARPHTTKVGLNEATGGRHPLGEVQGEDRQRRQDLRQRVAPDDEHGAGRKAQNAAFQR